MANSMLITGTSKGLGKAMADHYLAQGWQVAGCSRSDATIEHPDYQHYSLDVADEKAVTAMVREVHAAHGLDALINNAGIAAMNHLLLSSAGVARQIMETNVIGPFLFIREAAKLMQRSGGGRIVNFTTVAVPLDLEGEALYSASKAALESLTRVAARELGPMDILVNSIGPCPIPTDLTRQVPKEKLEALIDRQALKRAGTVEDVFPVVDFLISPKSAFITGQTLYLGGVFH
ncbi:MAG: SDR family NAD(P)-dependent oxidoreductase [Puniceicoccaceae bacterium]